MGFSKPYLRKFWVKHWENFGEAELFEKDQRNKWELKLVLVIELREFKLNEKRLQKDELRELDETLKNWE